MNYELAKKLKDAGFPQDKCSVIVHSGLQSNDIMATRAMAPSLSELIEACGSRFDYLERGLDGRWYAYHENFGDSIEESIDDSGIGSTPEEAVANLWLSLNAPKPSLNS